MKTNLMCSADIKRILLEGVEIGTEKKIFTDVEISNNELQGHLILRFSCGYTINIDERGICFQREVNRPTHDHGNTEQLRIHSNDKTLKWVDTSYCAIGYDIFRLEFGPVEVRW